MARANPLPFVEQHDDSARADGAAQSANLLDAILAPCGAGDDRSGRSPRLERVELGLFDFLEFYTATREGLGHPGVAGDNNRPRGVIPEPLDDLIGEASGSEKSHESRTAATVPLRRWRRRS